MLYATPLQEHGDQAAAPLFHSLVVNKRRYDSFKFISISAGIDARH